LLLLLRVLPRGGERRRQGVGQKEDEGKGQ
jgi:hypothetical protein